MARSFTDPSRWDYAHGLAEAAALVDHIPHITDSERHELKEMLTRFGGKAFGLALGRLMTGMLHAGVRVPWFCGVRNDTPRDISEASEMYFRGRVIARSSGKREDWACKAAGDAAGGGRSIVLAAEALDAHLDWRFRMGETAVVVQDYVEGAGVVVDIGPSVVAGGDVIRVQVGRARYDAHGTWLDADAEPVFQRQTFTSPTFDPDASVWLYTGQCEERFAEPSGYIAARRSTQGPFWMLDARKIATFFMLVVRECAIAAPLQCELVVHPKDGVAHLVQVRPRPQFGTRLRMRRPFVPQPMALTPRTSPAPYDVTGPLVCRGGKPSPCSLTSPDEPILRRWQEAIVVWDNAQQSGHVPRDPQGIVNVAHGGARGQLTCGPIATDVVHDSSGIPDDKRALWMAAQATPQAGVDRQTYVQLLALAEEGGHVVRMVSDGLCTAVIVCA